jgi:hypothetical protein
MLGAIDIAQSTTRAQRPLAFLTETAFLLLSTRARAGKQFIFCLHVSSFVTEAESIKSIKRSNNFVKRSLQLTPSLRASLALPDLLGVAI